MKKKFMSLGIGFILALASMVSASPAENKSTDMTGCWYFAMKLWNGSYKVNPDEFNLTKTVENEYNAKSKSPKDDFIFIFKDKKVILKDPKHTIVYNNVVFKNERFIILTKPSGYSPKSTTKPPLRMELIKCDYFNTWKKENTVSNTVANEYIIKEIKGTDFIVESKKETFIKLKNSSGSPFPDKTKYYLITGNVKIKTKGENIPLEGLLLYIKDNKSNKIASSGLTDKNGNYRLFVLQTGKYKIEIEKGYIKHFNLIKWTPKENLLDIKP